MAFDQITTDEFIQYFESKTQTDVNCCLGF